MKTKELENFTRLDNRNARRGRRNDDGPNISAMLLGVACAVGVLGLLTLLYHFG